MVQALQRDLTGYNRQVFEETSTLSFISVPIMLRSGCWGFLAFDDCHAERAWTALEIDVLKTAASLIAGAMERAQADERLRLSEERYALAARGASDGLWDWDVVADRAYFSPRLHEILGLQDGALGDTGRDAVRLLRWRGRGRHPQLLRDPLRRAASAGSASRRGRASRPATPAGSWPAA